MFDTVDLHPADPVAAIATGVTAMAAEDRGHWHGTALSDRLVQLLEVRERFDAEITRLTAQVETDPGVGSRWSAQPHRLARAARSSVTPSSPTHSEGSKG